LKSKLIENQRNNQANIIIIIPIFSPKSSTMQSYHELKLKWLIETGENVKLIKFIGSLSKKSVKVNDIMIDGQTPLSIAARAGQLECVQTLVQDEYGADVNKKNLTGSNALYMACWGYRRCDSELQLINYSKIIRFLIEKGSDCNVKDKKDDGYTCLMHMCASRGLFDKDKKNSERDDIIKLLLEHGAVRSIKNGFGNKAKKVAALNHNDGVFEIFKSYKLSKLSKLSNQNNPNQSIPSSPTQEPSTPLSNQSNVQVSLIQVEMAPDGSMSSVDITDQFAPVAPVSPVVPVAPVAPIAPIAPTSMQEPSKPCVESPVQTIVQSTESPISFEARKKDLENALIITDLERQLLVIKAQKAEQALIIANLERQLMVVNAQKSDQEALQVANQSTPDKITIESDKLQEDQVQVKTQNL